MPRALAALVLLLASIAAAPKEDKVRLSDDEQALVDLTNAERKKEGLPPLKVDPALMAAARAHAANMAKQEKMAHVLDGKTPPERAKEAGYKSDYVGENVAQGLESAKSVLRVWMDSDAHRKNVLKKEYADLGVAVVKSKKGARYWVQVFGKK